MAKQTLGAVAGLFFEQNFSTDVDNEPLPDRLKEPHLKVTFQFDVENENPESREKALSNLVASRNYLVHHFLERITSDSVESWIEASEYLDTQREEIMPELDYYRTHGSSVKDLGKKMSEILNGEEAGKQFINIDLGKDEPGMTLQREVKRNQWTDYLVNGKPVKSPVDIDSLPPGKYRLV